MEYSAHSMNVYRIQTKQNKTKHHRRPRQKTAQNIRCEWELHDATKRNKGVTWGGYEKKLLVAIFLESIIYLFKFID